MIDTKTVDHVEAAAASLLRLAARLTANTIKPATVAARLRQVVADLAETIKQANHYLPVRCRTCWRVMRIIFRTRDLAGVRCATCSSTQVLQQ